MRILLSKFLFFTIIFVFYYSILNAKTYKCDKYTVEFSDDEISSLLNDADGVNVMLSNDEERVLFLPSVKDATSKNKYKIQTETESISFFETDKGYMLSVNDKNIRCILQQYD